MNNYLRYLIVSLLPLAPFFFSSCTPAAKSTSLDVNASILDNANLVFYFDNKSLNEIPFTKVIRKYKDQIFESSQGLDFEFSEQLLQASDVAQEDLDAYVLSLSNMEALSAGKYKEVYVSFAAKFFKKVDVEKINQFLRASSRPGGGTCARSS